MRIKRILWMILGCIGIVLGALGAVLPMLPAFPFLLLSAFCFSRSSYRLHHWFINTNLYKNNLESYVKGNGMTRQAKIRVMITVTVLMAFGFTMMLEKGLYVPCMILTAVWLFHIIYFLVCVKTCRPEVSSDL